MLSTKNRPGSGRFPRSYERRETARARTEKLPRHYYYSIASLFKKGAYPECLCLLGDTKINIENALKSLDRCYYICYTTSEMNEIKERIKELRKRLGLTQEAFAEKLGISVNTVRRWEYGKTKPSRMAQKLLKEIEVK